jgi:hypothetical protein
VKLTKKPHLKQGGTANREARALSAARKALDGMSDDPEALRLFIAMVPLLGSRMLI